MKSEKCTLQDLEYGNNTEKLGKCEMHTVGTGKWRTNLKKVENGKSTRQDLEYGKKTENEENEKHTWQDLEYAEKQ